MFRVGLVNTLLLYRTTHFRRKGRRPLRKRLAAPICYDTLLPSWDWGFWLTLDKGGLERVEVFADGEQRVRRRFRLAARIFIGMAFHSYCGFSCGVGACCPPPASTLGAHPTNNRRSSTTQVNKRPEDLHQLCRCED